ncbi:MAG TPA: tetratricopeptide repeat protein [Vicinamibacterales bacterium]|nr:tetratricopeptide repeat protein [Vicinamibacterales bacterium]
MTALLAACALTAGVRGADGPVLSPSDPGYWPRVGALERAVTANPEDLQAGADYRQLLIAGGFFDRSIDFFEKAEHRKGAGANLELNLALAYVDKVPTSGEIRRVYLGRDAINALSRSIAIHPTVLAYYIRGFINLHFDHGLFHREDKGIADLEQARALTRPETAPTLAARVWVTLGDAYWRLKQPARARELWAAGASRYPGDAELKVRTTSAEPELTAYIAHVFHLATRVDTSLHGATDF